MARRLNASTIVGEPEDRSTRMSRSGVSSRMTFSISVYVDMRFPRSPPSLSPAISIGSSSHLLSHCRGALAGMYFLRFLETPLAKRCCSTTNRRRLMSGLASVESHATNSRASSGSANDVRNTLGFEIPSALLTGCTAFGSRLKTRCWDSLQLRIIPKSSRCCVLK